MAASGSNAKQAIAGEPKAASPGTSDAGSQPGATSAPSSPPSPAGSTAAKRTASGESKPPSPTHSPAGSRPGTPPATSPSEPSLFAPFPTLEGHMGVIPAEINQLIYEMLPYDASIFLSQTNKYHHINVAPVQYVDPKAKVAFLKKAEVDYKQHFTAAEIKKKRGRGRQKWKDLPPAVPDAGGYACFTCLRVRPTPEFSTKQTSGAMGKGNGRAERRFCIPCGVRHDYYSTGAAVRVAGAAGTVKRRCKVCREMKDGLHCQKCHNCQDCIGLKPDHPNTHCPKCGKSDSLRGEKRPPPPSPPPSNEEEAGAEDRPAKRSRSL